MSRGAGRVFRPVNGAGRKAKAWFLDYTINGVRHCESSHTTVKGEAQDVLRERIGDRKGGKITGRPDRVTVHDLRELVETQYDLDGLRSKERVVQCWNHVEGFLGSECRVLDVTPTRLDDYAKARLADGAARQTVNNELSALRRGFSLAVEKQVLATAPRIKLPKVENVREGFFEEDDFAAVLLELPAYAQAPIRFCRFTGWRIEEVLTLTWDRIDWERHGIRLSARQTKGKKARLFPFGLAPDLKALLEAAWATREGLFVFQGPRKGKRVGYTTLLHHWQGATKRAGCEGRLIHDLRRTAVRDFVEADVDRETIKALCGIHTDSIFTRYHIVNDANLEAAVGKRFGYAKPTRSLKPSPSGTEPLSSSAATPES